MYHAVKLELSLRVSDTLVECLKYSWGFCKCFLSDFKYVNVVLFPAWNHVILTSYFQGILRTKGRQ